MEKIESIDNLKNICQLTYEGWTDQPIVYYFFRKISIYITWVLLHFPLSGNGVTLLGIVSGLLASVLMGFNFLTAGALVLLFTIILDFCDGEVTRYRKQQSKEGEYLDHIFHFIINPSVFAGIAIGAYRMNPSLSIIIAGFICVISVFLLNMVVTYAKWITVWGNWLKILNKLNMNSESGANIQNIISSMIDNNIASQSDSDIPSYLQKARFTKFGNRLSIIITFWNFPYIFIIAIVSALIQALNWTVIIGGIHLSAFELTLLFYATTYPVIISALLFYNLSVKSIGKEYNLFLLNLSSIMKKNS